MLPFRTFTVFHSFFILEAFQYLIPNILGFFACLVAMRYYWQLRREPRMGLTLWIAAMAAVWNLGGVMMRSAGSAAVAITGYELTASAGLYASAMVLPLAVQQAGVSRPLGAGTLRFLLTYPAAIVAIKWATNLLVTGYRFEAGPPVSFAWPRYGPLAGIEYAFGYGGALVGATLLAQGWSVSRNRVHSMQCGALIGLIILPLMGSVVQTAQQGEGWTRRISIAGLSMAVCTLAYLFVLSKESQFTLTPIARDRVVDSMQDGLVVTDATGRVVDLNPSAARLLQAGEEREWKGRPVSEMLAKLGIGVPKWGAVTAVHTESAGVPVDLEVRASPILTGSGPIGRAYLLRDITEASRTEADLRRAMALAEQAAVAKSEFLATVSHEIRTPLNGVIGMSSLILGEAGKLPDGVREKMETLDASALTLRNILDDILDFAKIESGGISLEEAPVSLREIVEQVTSLFREQAAAKGVEVAAEVDAEAPEAIWGDSLRIRQVLANLVGNAVKFTAVGSVKVLVAFSKEVANNGIGLPVGEELWVAIRVRDTGIGIEPSRQRQLFERFIQADNSTTREFGGTGLGLAISKKLVGLMNGRISVESRKGEGTEFRVDLPVRPAPRAWPGRARPAAAPPKPLQLRILLAEDNVVNQRVARAMLERLGCHVVVARNGREAVEQAIAGVYDAILMDCHMPELDGYEATRRIREAGISTQVVALTASVLASDRERCREAGMNAFVAKPVDFEELRRVLLREPAPPEHNQTGTPAVSLDTEPRPLLPFDSLS